MRDVLLLAIFLIFLFLGLGRPFILGLGFAWVDFFSPQRITYGFFTMIPVSLVMALAALLVWLPSRKTSMPARKGMIVLLLVWAVWLTLTTTWADFPEPAWAKWDWAVKVPLFAAFIPFLFRTRIQIEALLLTVLASVSATMVTFGAKVLISGGGYGRDLGLYGGNQGLGEGSTLANVAVALIPITLYLWRYSLILPQGRLFRAAFSIGVIVAAIATAVGTYERTALMTLAVLAFMVWLSSRRKVATLVLMGGLAAALIPVLATEGWKARMQTINDYQADSSAFSRVKVWEWTMDYVAKHPMGGGFDMYRGDNIVMQFPDGSSLERHGVAFHNMYFEVLGEQGLVGLAIFAALILGSLVTALAVANRPRAPDPWLHGLALALARAMITYCVGALFIGIAFQPFLYYLIALMILVGELTARAAAPVRRSRAAPLIAGPALTG